MAETTEFEKELRRLRDADRERRGADFDAMLRDAAALQTLRASVLPLTAEQRRMLNHARVELGERLSDLVVHWRALGGNIRLELGDLRLDSPGPELSPMAVVHEAAPPPIPEIVTRPAARQSPEIARAERIPATPRAETPTVAHPPAVAETPTVAYTPAVAHSPAVAETPMVAETPEPALVEPIASEDTPPARSTERNYARRRYQYRSQPLAGAEPVAVSPDQVLALVEPARNATSPEDLAEKVVALFALLGPLAQRHDSADFPPPLVAALQSWWAALAASRLRLTPPSDLRRVRFGFRREGGVGVPDTVEQAVLDYVRRRERDGGSIAHIAQELTLIQVPARGDKWHRAQLDRLIHEDRDAESGATTEPAPTATPDLAEVTEPEVAKSKVAKSKVAEPEVAAPDVAKSEAAAPEFAATDVANEAAAPEFAKSEAVEPGIAKTEIDEAATAEAQTEPAHRKRRKKAEVAAAPIAEHLPEPSPPVVRRKGKTEPEPKPPAVEWRVRGEWRAVERDLRAFQAAGPLSVGFTRNSELRTRSSDVSLIILHVIANPADARRTEDKLMNLFPDANLVEQAPDDDAPGTLVLYVQV
jgi:hypothetical protein